jgi:hypothetical protein
MARATTVAVAVAAVAAVADAGVAATRPVPPAMATSTRGIASPRP